MNDKVTIYRVPSFQWRGIGKAADALGVSDTAIRLYLGGRTETLSKAKRSRIVIRTITSKKGK